jgi:ABC-type sulfate transport system permease component
VRYVPYILVALGGMVLGVEGVRSLGIGAYYGGVLLASLAVGMPFIVRQHQEVLREREEKRRANAQRGSGAATR